MNLQGIWSGDGDGLPYEPYALRLILVRVYSPLRGHAPWAFTLTWKARRHRETYV